MKSKNKIIITNEKKYISFLRVILFVFVILYLLCLSFLFFSCRTIKTESVLKVDSTKQKTAVQKVTHTKKNTHTDTSVTARTDTSEKIIYHFARPVQLKNIFNDTNEVIKVEIQKNKIHTHKKAQIYSVIKDSVRSEDSANEQVQLIKNEVIKISKKANNSWLWWLILIVAGAVIVVVVVYKYRGEIIAFVVKKLS